jgi:hypothetical protein
MAKKNKGILLYNQNESFDRSPLPQKPLKYNVGDLVYSYQTKTTPASIIDVRVSKDGNYSHSYKLCLTLPDGTTKESHWTGEDSISTTPIVE